MSEEVLAADSLLSENAELRRALDVALNERDAEHDINKALLIKMRRYIISHGLLIGECVAWMNLKRKYRVGESTEADDRWLADYEQQKARSQ
jgi:hypothetical protein